MIRNKTTVNWRQICYHWRLTFISNLFKISMTKTKGYLLLKCSVATVVSDGWLLKIIPTQLCLSWSWIIILLKQYNKTFNRLCTKPLRHLNIYIKPRQSNQTRGYSTAHMRRFFTWCYNMFENVKTLKFITQMLWPPQVWQLL